MKLVGAAIFASAFNSSLAQFGWAGQTFHQNEQNRMDEMSFQDRILHVVKTLWPECKNKDAFWCKDLIDNELAQLTFPGAENIKSVIIYRRSSASPTSNAIAIIIDDNDLCVGRNGDGLVHYDWDWCGAGHALTSEYKIMKSAQLIQPSKWTRMIKYNPNDECKDSKVERNKSSNACGGDFGE